MTVENTEDTSINHLDILRDLLDYEIQKKYNELASLDNSRSIINNLISALIIIITILFTNTDIKTRIFNSISETILIILLLAISFILFVYINFGINLVTGFKTYKIANKIQSKDLNQLKILYVEMIKIENEIVIENRKKIQFAVTIRKIALIFFLSTIFIIIYAYFRDIQL